MIKIEHNTRTLVQMARDEIAGKLSAFLASGGAIQAIPDGVSGLKDSPTFNHAISNPTRRAHEKRQSPNFDQSRYYDMKHAIEGHKKAAHLTRVQKSRELRQMAANGMSLSEASKAMGISYNYARKIASENQIVFRTQTLKTIADAFCKEVA